jgi:DNA-binding MarR family transcriptional regulator
MRADNLRQPSGMENTSMGMNNEQLIKEIVDNLRRLSHAVYLDGTKMNRLFGVTGPQGVVIRNLRDNGPASSAELSRSMHVSPSNMTGLIDRLEKKNLVVRTRKEWDRRVSLIELTDAGRAIGKELPDPLEMKLESRLADLDTDHVGRLAAAMNELLAVLRAVDPDLATVEDFFERSPDKERRTRQPK